MKEPATTGAFVHSDEKHVLTARKPYDAAISFLEEKRLSEFTHNKTVRKAIESYRITDEQKRYLSLLKF